MPEYNDDGSVKTVDQMAAENPIAAAKSFSELDEAVQDGELDPDEAYPSRYAVEGNDLSNFKGVSEEYRTYASEVDSPLDWDASVADNSQEKLDALAEEGVDEADDDEKNSATGSNNEQTGTKKAAAKKSQPPIRTDAQNDKSGDK